MTPAELKALESAYQAASSGNESPSCIYVPEGAFVKNADGSYAVFDFDAEGNHYALSVEEQEKRRVALRERLANGR